MESRLTRKATWVCEVFERVRILHASDISGGNTGWDLDSGGYRKCAISKSVMIDRKSRTYDSSDGTR